VPIWRGGRSRGRQQFVHKLWAAFCQPEVMSELTPEEVVRRYWAEFGPTYNDAVASSRRWLHEDVNLVSFGSRIENLDALLADLEQARDKMGIHGYRVYMRNVAANGNAVFAERREELIGADGAVKAVFDVVGVFTVDDGRIRRLTNYFFDSREMAAGWSGTESGD
jgi:limonene-1,2-epoxide hydrolase